MLALWDVVCGMAFEPSMLIQNLVSCFNVFLLLNVPGEIRKTPWPRFLFHYLILFVSLNLSNAVWEVFLHMPGSYLITHLLLMLEYALIRRLSIGKAVLLTVFLFHAYECASIITSSLIPVLLASATYGTVIEVVLRNGVVITSILPALLFHNHSLLDFWGIQRDVTGFGLFISAITFLLTCWFHFFSRSQFSQVPDVFVLLAFASILSLSLVSYYLIWSVCKHSDRERKILAENYSMKSEQYLLQISQQNLEDMRRVRHDIKNHFSYLQYLCADRQFEQIRQYLDQMSESLIAPLSTFDFGNRSVNAVLNLEQSKAQANGCTLDCRVIVPEVLPFAEVRLCALLTNLIDNALEACARYGFREAVVEVGINQKGSMLYICVLNPIPESVTDIRELTLQRTSKKDVSTHGYGVRIIESIVREYNGHIARSIDKGRYRVDIILDMYYNSKEAGKAT